MNQSCRYPRTWRWLALDSWRPAKQKYKTEESGFYDDRLGTEFTLVMSTVGSSGKFPRKWDIGLWKQASMKLFWVDEKRDNAFFQIRKGHIYMHSCGRFHVSPTLLLYPPRGHLKSGHNPRSARQAIQESHLSGGALEHPINNFWQSYLYTPRDNEN